MPVLKNARHEQFAQEIASGKSATEAYERAGYNSHRGNAARLSANEHISARIEEIQSAAAQKVGIDKAKVLTELGKIAFSDIRKAVEWHGTLVREEDNPDGGDVLVVRNIFSNHVRLVDSDQIDDDTAGAIAEVKQGRDGVTIKFHDKQAALVAIGKDLGMFKDRVEHSGGITITTYPEDASL